MKIGIIRNLFRSSIERFILDLLTHMESEPVKQYITKRFNLLYLIKKGIGHKNYNHYIANSNVEIMLEGAAPGLYIRTITDIKQFIILGKLWGFLKLK